MQSRDRARVDSGTAMWGYGGETTPQSWCDVGAGIGSCGYGGEANPQRDAVQEKGEARVDAGTATCVMVVEQTPVVV